MNKKATSKELQQHIISTKNALDEVGKDMQLKANISDTTKSLD